MNHGQIVRARITRDITYEFLGVIFIIRKDTNCIVDVDNGIGLVNGQHIEIKENEYNIILTDDNALFL